MLDENANGQDMRPCAVGQEKGAFFGLVPWTKRAVQRNTGVDLFRFHHVNQSKQCAYPSASAGTMNSTDIFGSENAGKDFSIAAGAYDGDNLELTRHGNEGEQFIMPEAEDKPSAPGMELIHGLTVFLTDTERRTDGGIDAAEQCFGEGEGKMHDFLSSGGRGIALDVNCDSSHYPDMPGLKSLFQAAQPEKDHRRSIVPEETRLNKALADAGVCSRRGADALIFAGQVYINGRRAESPGERVLPEDSLVVQGRRVARKPRESCWLMLHKPARVVSTVNDPQGRETVLDFVPEPWAKRRLYPVGRLDYFSEGLLLLTDDGALAHRLMHPRWHLPKIYHVLVRPERDARSVEKALSLMARGMTLAEGERLAPVDIRVLDSKEQRLTLEMTLRQGINRQIRRMCRDADFTILRLKRVQEGPLRLGNLPSGQARPLTEEERIALRRAVGL